MKKLPVAIALFAAVAFSAAACTDDSADDQPVNLDPAPTQVVPSASASASPYASPSVSVSPSVSKSVSASPSASVSTKVVVPVDPDDIPDLPQQHGPKH